MKLKKSTKKTKKKLESVGLTHDPGHKTVITT